MRQTGFLAAALAAAFFLLFALSGVAQAAEAAVRLIDESPQTDVFRVGEVPVKVFPVAPPYEGKWIVEPVRLDVAQKAATVELCREALADIGKRLAPLPLLNGSGNWALPQVILSPAMVSEEGRPGKTSAWYMPDYGKSIVLTWRPVSLGRAGVEYALAHELGHWVWFNALTEAERLRYREIAGGFDRRDRELMETYDLDEERLLWEWFAEDFRVYGAGVPTCDEIKSRLGRSRGDPEALRDLFSRFRAPEQ